MKRGQVWRGSSGEEIIEILGPTFTYKGELYVPAKKIGSIRPSCEAVDWILAGGKRDRVLEVARSR